MVGDLTIDQISSLSGLSQKKVERALKSGDLRDRSPESVGEWLNSLIQTKMSKPKNRVGIRLNRTPVVHRKWD